MIGNPIRDKYTLGAPNDFRRDIVANCKDKDEDEDLLVIER